MIRVACPDRPQVQRELFRGGVAGAREREHAPPLVTRHLGHEVPRRAESVDAEPFGRPARHQRAVADQPGAQERRGLGVGEPLRHREGERRVGDGALGVAAVEGVAGECRAVAQILAAGAAVAALPAGPAEPRDADVVADPEPGHAGPQGRDRADDLVAEHQRQLRIGQVPVSDVEVGATHAAGRDRDEDLAGARFRLGKVGQSQRAARAVEEHGAHQAGSCCVRQWIVPNPQTRSTAWIPITGRSRNSSASSPRAARSWGSLKVGTRTPAFAM